MATKRDLEILDRNSDLLMGEILESTLRCNATMRTLLGKYRKSVYTQIEQTYLINNNQQIIDTYIAKKSISRSDAATIHKYISARKAEERLTLIVKQIERELQELPLIKTNESRERFLELIKRKGEYEIQLYNLPPAIEEYKTLLRKSSSDPRIISECLTCADTIAATFIKRDKITADEQERYAREIQELVEANKQELITKHTRPYKTNPTLYQQKLHEAKSKGLNLENNVNGFKQLCQESERIRFEVTTRAERRAAHKDVNDIDEPVA